MVPPPGTLLEPAEVQIGALVDARDDSGIWYRARVIAKNGRGARTSVTVRFQRFNQKHNRKFKKSHKAIRVRSPVSPPSPASTFSSFSSEIPPAFV